MISGSKADEPQSMRRSSSQEVTCEPRRPIFQWRIFAARRGSAPAIGVLAHQAQGLRHAGVREHSEAGLDLGAGPERALAEHDARGPAVLDDDPIDGRVREDRAAVREEALR